MIGWQIKRTCAYMACCFAAAPAARANAVMTARSRSNKPTCAGARTGSKSTDNGSCYTAIETRKFAKDIGLLTLTTPDQSPQSNRMAEAFVRTFNRDYAVELVSGG